MFHQQVLATVTLTERNVIKSPEASPCMSVGGLRMRVMLRKLTLEITRSLKMCPILMLIF